jgi:hypothetical protein
MDRMQEYRRKGGTHTGLDVFVQTHIPQRWGAAYKDLETEDVLVATPGGASMRVSYNVPADPPYANAAFTEECDHIDFSLTGDIAINAGTGEGAAIDLTAGDSGLSMGLPMDLASGGYVAQQQTTGGQVLATRIMRETTVAHFNPGNASGGNNTVIFLLFHWLKPTTIIFSEYRLTITTTHAATITSHVLCGSDDLHTMAVTDDTSLSTTRFNAEDKVAHVLFKIEVGAGAVNDDEGIGWSISAEQLLQVEGVPFHARPFPTTISDFYWSATDALVSGGATVPALDHVYFAGGAKIEIAAPEDLTFDAASTDQVAGGNLVTPGFFGEYEEVRFLPARARSPGGTMRDGYLVATCIPQTLWSPFEPGREAGEDYDPDA